MDANGVQSPGHSTFTCKLHFSSVFIAAHCMEWTAERQEVGKGHSCHQAVLRMNKIENNGAG